MGKIVDIHSHVIPQMDDGSDSVRMSCQMLQMLREQGVAIVCATPHFYSRENGISEFLARRSAAVQRLSDQKIAVQLLLGAEVEFFTGISECDALDALCIAGTKTLLLEMPFSMWTARQVEEVMRLSLDRGFRVVLAHPERFLFCNSNRCAVERFSDMGVGIQVNAQTLLHWRTRRLALLLLASAKAPFLGSDCHDLRERAPKIDTARAVLRKKLGEGFLRRLDQSMNAALIP